MSLTSSQLKTLHELLEQARTLDPSSDAYLELERAVSHLTKSAKKKRRLHRKQLANASDAQALRTPGLARARLAQTGNVEASALHFERACYVCKRPYRQMHEWYPLLCPECGARSAALRDQPISLTERRALVTGGRVKIGYATSLRMLRAGAEVHVTTRFPRDAQRRFAAEADAAQWSNRLHLHGLDFRDLRQLLTWLELRSAEEPFNIIINNAAQTAWHPPAYFAALRQGEEAPPASLQLLATQFDALDVARVDSWVQPLGEIAPVDLVEAQVVNAIAPFLICNRLRENMTRSKHGDRYIINVTAVEGQFARPEKPDRHPHTNMAKASLNMMTRTSASTLARDGIFMVSVDPGWMSTEGPHVNRDFHPPLAAEDCAARVLHPIAQGLAGAPVFGVLLKDFEPVPW